MKHHQLITCLLIVLALVVGGHRASPGANDNEITTGTPDSTTSPSTAQSTATTSSKATTRAPKSATSSKKTTTTTTTIKPTKTPTTEPAQGGCPHKCTCTLTTVDCSHNEWAELPWFDSRQNISFVNFIFHDNHLDRLNWHQMVPIGRIEMLNLSDNLLKDFWDGRKKEFTNMRMLDLSENRFESIDKLHTWSMPQLVELSLASNPLTKIPEAGFPLNSTLLERLNLADLSKLKTVDASAFKDLPNLQYLNLSGSLRGHYLADQLIAGAKQLKQLDLSNNELAEVPLALRGSRSIERLVLSQNKFTSLRRSDFTGQQVIKQLEINNCPSLERVDSDTFSGLKNLDQIIISNNPVLTDFSPNAIQSPAVSCDSAVATEIKFSQQLSLLDLSNNSLTTLDDLTACGRVQIKEMRLANNPWHCDCRLKWMVSGVPTASQIGREPIHCETPLAYKGMEISQFFKMVDCDVLESSLQKMVLISFLLFLIVLTIAVFIQKTDICRRHDQYGTIYYTKASFPMTDSAGFPIDKV